MKASWGTNSGAESNAWPGCGFPDHKALTMSEFSPKNEKPGMLFLSPATRLERFQFPVLYPGFKETPSTANLFSYFGKGQKLAGHALVNDRCFLTWETTKGETIDLT
jgi:hypothetical protein